MRLTTSSVVCRWASPRRRTSHCPYSGRRCSLDVQNGAEIFNKANTSSSPGVFARASNGNGNVTDAGLLARFYLIYSSVTVAFCSFSLSRLLSIQFYIPLSSRRMWCSCMIYDIFSADASSVRYYNSCSRIYSYCSKRPNDEVVA